MNKNKSKSNRLNKPNIMNNLIFKNFYLLKCLQYYNIAQYKINKNKNFSFFD